MTERVTGEYALTTCYTQMKETERKTNYICWLLSVVLMDLRREHLGFL